MGPLPTSLSPLPTERSGVYNISMRRLLAAWLCLALPGVSFAVEVDLPRLAEPEIAGVAGSQIAPGIPAHTAPGGSMPLRVEQETLALQPETVSIQSAAPLAAVVQMASRQSKEERSEKADSGVFSTFASFFDGARNFASDYLRTEPRAAAINAAATLLTARGDAAIPSLTRDRTAEAITALRGFRLSLGHATADPAFVGKISADASANERAKTRLARHIRGLEKNQFSADGELEEPDSRQTHVLGLVVKGRESVEALLADRARSAARLSTLLDANPHAFNMAKRFLRSLTGPLAALAAPGFYMPGMTLWPWLAAALWLVNEPVAVLRHKFGRDRFHERAERQTRDFLDGKTDWAYDAKAYALQGGLVDALLRHGKTEEGILYPWWNQDFHGSRGLFGRLMMKRLLYRGPAGQQDLNDDRDRWVTVDRLLRRGRDGEPELVLVVRSSRSRPRFPKPVVEREPLFSLQPELVPVPIPVRPGPRR